MFHVSRLRKQLGEGTSRIHVNIFVDCIEESLGLQRELERILDVQE